MVQNEQTTEEHSTLEQQSPGRLDHPARLTFNVVDTCNDDDDDDDDHNCIY